MWCESEIDPSGDLTTVGIKISKTYHVIAKMLIKISCNMIFRCAILIDVALVNSL